MKKSVQIPLKNIKITFFVRTGIDLDRVAFFKDLYSSDEGVEPISVWEIPPAPNTPVGEKLYELIDGRHRLEAAREMGFTSIDSHISHEHMSDKDKVLNAILENSGGALPPTLADYEHTIELLLKLRATKKEIVESFPLPKAVTAKFYKLTLAKMYKHTVRNAVEAVLSSRLTVKQAADEYKVDVADLKQILANRQERETTIDDLIKGVEYSVRSLSQQYTKKGKIVLEMFENGEIGQNDVARYLLKLKESSDKVHQTAQNVRERILAVTKPQVIAKDKFMEEISGKAKAEATA